MPTPSKHPSRFPGTDAATGWPLVPKYPCAKGLELCNLALVATPSACIYRSPTCPFYGRFPRVDGAKAEQGSWSWEI